MNPVTVTIPNASVPIGKTHVKKAPTKEREIAADASGKIKRDALLYMENLANPDFAQCKSCWLFNVDQSRCGVLPTDFEVKAEDSCGYYKEGKQYGDEIGPDERMSPEDAGFVKNTQVRCENCEYGGTDCGLYLELNKLPGFDLDTKIAPRGCCNAFIAKGAKPAEDAKSVVLKAAGLIIRTPDNRALFVKRASGQDHEGEWSFPGGAIENAETAELAAIRETREETGWIVPEDAKLEKIDNRVSPEGVEFTTFEIKTNNPFIPELDDENQGWAWAPLHDPPQPVHPGVNRTIGGMAKDEVPGKKAANQATSGELRSVIKFPPPKAPRATRAINVEFANGGAGKELKKAPEAERFENRGGITEKDKHGPLGKDEAPEDEKTVDFQRQTDTNGNSLSFSTVISGGRKM